MKSMNRSALRETADDQDRQPQSPAGWASPPTTTTPLPHNLPLTTMSTSKIGGEYGEVRANIDADKLNAYLAANVPAVKAPVDIKQFKVRPSRAQGSEDVNGCCDSLDRCVLFVNPAWWLACLTERVECVV